jgi:hypothetical protein
VGQRPVGVKIEHALVELRRGSRGQHFDALREDSLYGSFWNTVQRSNCVGRLVQANLDESKVDSARMAAVRRSGVAS